MKKGNLESNYEKDIRDAKFEENANKFSITTNVCMK
jgi:hypothetical protein